MSYVHKIIGTDEKLVGIARLHWIYVVQGITWFFLLTALGWIMEALLMRAMMALSNSMGNTLIPAPLFNIGNNIVLFMMVAGALMFLMFVVKVIASNVALTDRRIIYKTGIIFVKVQNVDLEEIRGENLDLGMLGRFLGYGSVLLDCRFLGDVRLPNIENPEIFLRALHKARADIQDSLKVLVGKQGTDEPVQKLVIADDPAPHPTEPEPEAKSEIEKEQWHPADVPGGPKPGKKMIKSMYVAGVDDFIQDQIVAPPSLEQVRLDNSRVQATPSTAPESTVEKDKAVDPATIAKIVAQATPQIAQQVVKEMAAQGLVNVPDTKQSSEKPDGLTGAFDEVAVVEETVDHNENVIKPALH